MAKIACNKSLLHAWQSATCCVLRVISIDVCSIYHINQMLSLVTQDATHIQQTVHAVDELVYTLQVHGAEEVYQGPQRCFGGCATRKPVF